MLPLHRHPARLTRGERAARRALLAANFARALRELDRLYADQTTRRAIYAAVGWSW